MIFEEIRLYNFGIYQGHHTISLDSPDTKSETILFFVRGTSVFHTPVFGTFGRNLKIQTTTIGHFVGFVFWLCGLDLSGIELHLGAHF